MTLQRFREWLTLGLIVLLPFHAFMVTVLTKVFMGSGHAPLSSLAIWKEGLFGLILLIAFIEIASSFELRASRKSLKIDLLDVLIIALVFLGIVVSISYKLSAINFIFGFRYDFIPLIAFLILRRVSWSDVFLARAMKGMLSAGVIIAVYGIISFFLPATFFTWLGYSDLHSLYLPNGPLAPFQQIGGTALRRIQSVMSGPNQLGLWLLMPISIAVAKFQEAKKQDIQIKSKSSICKKLHVWHLDIESSLVLGVCILFLTSLVLTFSRAAWIGAAVIIGVAMWPSIHALSRRALFILLSSFFIFLFLVVLLFSSVILRAASSRGHIENPLKAIQIMIDHPFGLGLGTAGPASNRTSDACVLLDAGADTSWASDRPNLCVFVDAVQVQPLDRVCSCPFLPENWYLQIGVEMGWLGLGLYMVLVFVVLKKLIGVKSQESGVRREFSYLLSPIFLSLSVAALFLHAWEDSAVAYTVWVLIAVQMSWFVDPEQA